MAGAPEPAGVGRRPSHGPHGAFHARVARSGTLPAAIVLLCGLTLGACTPEPGRLAAGEVEDEAGRVERRAASLEAGAHGHHDEAPASTAPSEHSLYRLSAIWTDQHGEPLELADLAGRPVVMAMVYTHCTFACPRILAQMKRIENALGEGGGALASAGTASGSAEQPERGHAADPTAGDVRFVLVSIDPERDTPDRLADFAEGTRLDPTRWTLINGADDDVRALSVLLGVKYRATGGGDYAHSNVLTMLDERGEIVHRVEGLDADLGGAIEVLRKLAGREEG